MKTARNVKVVIKGVAVILAFAALYLFLYHYWWVFVSAGVLLFVASFFLAAPVENMDLLEGTMTDDSENNPALPKGEIVNEPTELLVTPKPPRQPSVPVGMKKREPAPSYPRHVLSRFAIRQRAKTAETEAEAMRQENEIRKLGLEGVRLDREAGTY